MNIHDFQKRKQSNKKISMITCYDYTSAKIIENTEIDVVLVGDTLAMVMHGHPDTTSATVDMLVAHTQAVARGINSKFIVADMPFMSYRKTITETIENVQRLIRSKPSGVPGRTGDGDRPFGVWVSMNVAVGANDNSRPAACPEQCRRQLPRFVRCFVG